MSKQIAFLEYSFVFDPSETWSNGYQFEKFLSDFCSSHGFEAQIIPTTGGTGRRVIYLTRNKIVPKIENKPNPAVNNQIKKVQQTIPPKNFKKFVEPKHFDTRPNKTVYYQGRSLRKKVRMP